MAVQFVKSWVHTSLYFNFYRFMSTDYGLNVLDHWLAFVKQSLYQLCSTDSVIVCCQSGWSSDQTVRYVSFNLGKLEL
jgi:hypothetical protein